jgi:hypothetical protein
MPKKRDEPPSRVTEDVSVEESSSSSMEEIPPVETWTTPAEGMALGPAGPIPETETPRSIVEAPPVIEVVASVESWMLPVEENWVPTPDELWPLPPGGIPEVDSESEIALEAIKYRC